ncbi:hypothetical protein apy_01060 [Aeropyrum pernix]|uniref:Uncharacterized protein n=1 Tax=Aeropyrum pernix TaxID=56636 RepID=A0A401H7J8_AERPX|nr:hypothetical protein apy_01060 [Aeropyrum pernix]
MLRLPKPPNSLLTVKNHPPHTPSLAGGLGTVRAPHDPRVAGGLAPGFLLTALSMLLEAQVFKLFEDVAPDLLEARQALG